METQMFHYAKMSSSKNPLKTNQNPSRYYNNSITNLKFQHKTKYHLSKILIYKIEILPRGQNPLSYQVYSIYNESKHNISKANKSQIQSSLVSKQCVLHASFQNTLLFQEETKAEKWKSRTIGTESKITGSDLRLIFPGTDDDGWICRQTDCCDFFPSQHNNNQSANQF